MLPVGGVDVVAVAEMGMSETRERWNVGDVVDFKKGVESLLRTKKLPDNPLLLGEVESNKAEATATKASSSISGTRIVVNKALDPWHYPWVSVRGKPVHHCVRLYVFQKIEGESLRCLGVIRSPDFTVNCSRPSQLVKRKKDEHELEPPPRKRIRDVEREQKKTPTPSTESKKTQSTQKKKSDPKSLDCGSKIPIKKERETGSMRFTIVPILTSISAPVPAPESPTQSKTKVIFRLIRSIARGDYLPHFQKPPAPDMASDTDAETSTTPSAASASLTPKSSDDDLLSGIDAFSSILLSDFVSGSTTGFVELFADSDFFPQTYTGSSLLSSTDELLSSSLITTPPPPAAATESSSSVALTTCSNMPVELKRFHIVKDMAEALLKSESFEREVSEYIRNIRNMDESFLSEDDLFKGFSRIVIRHIETSLASKNLTIQGLENLLSFATRPNEIIDNEQYAIYLKEFKSKFLRRLKRVSKPDVFHLSAPITEPYFNVEGSWVAAGRGTQDDILLKLNQRGFPGFMSSLLSLAMSRLQIFISKDWLFIRSLVLEVRHLLALDGEIHPFPLQGEMPSIFENQPVNYRAFLDHERKRVHIETHVSRSSAPGMLMHVKKYFALGSDGMELIATSNVELINVVTQEKEWMGESSSKFFRLWHPDDSSQLFESSAKEGVPL